MPDTFSFRESYELLATNPKTFKDWLLKAHIDAAQQINQFDPRKKYITKEQLRHLAELHGRTLPESIDEQEAEQQDPMTINRLTELFAASQQQILQRLDQVDRAQLQSTSLLQEIQSMRASLPTEQQTLQRFDQLEQSLLQALASLQELFHENINGHSNGVQKAEQSKEAEPVTVPTTVIPLSVSVKASAAKRPAGPVRSSAKKKKTTRGKKLSAGLVLLRDFAGIHHIITERASKAGEAGKISVVHGKWLVNSRWASEAIDAQGQHDFYEVFHEREDFTACPQCPHSLIS
jgi:flagellar motor protein MotB